MERSENVVDSYVENRYFECGCLFFKFAKTKCDQTGNNYDQLWHFYETTSNPETFPILDIAPYLFTNIDIMIYGLEATQ